MTIRNIGKFLPASACLMLLAMCVTFAQKGGVNRMKKTWSPPDNSFTVEAPVDLREIKGEYNDESHERFQSIKLFGSSEANTSFGVFEIVILHLSRKKELNVTDKLKGLEFFVGGDDHTPTKETDLNVQGMPAREVLFVGPTKCSKGLIIDAGDRIYVLGLVVNVCEDLNSPVSKRFFNSFHLERRRRP